MPFDASRIPSLGKQIDSAQDGLETANRLQHAVAEASRPSVFGSILQDMAKPVAVANAGIYQNIASAGFARYQRDMQQGFGVSTPPLMSKVQDFARSMNSYQTGLSQSTPAQLAFSKLQVMNGFNVGALDSRVQSLNKMADLTRSLARPYKLRDGGFVSALGGITAALDQVNRLNSSSAIGGFQSIQTWRAPLFCGHVARAISEAARVFSGWKPLLDDLKEYRLQDVRVMPVPRAEDALTRTPPTAPTDPFVDAEPHPTVAPDTVPVQEVPGKTLETPFQLDGGWSLLWPLQPVENMVYGVLNGPLIVKILVIGVGQLVVMVIGSGLVYFLFYCC